jgi:hypothetical protein
MDWNTGMEGVASRSKIEPQDQYTLDGKKTREPIHVPFLCHQQHLIGALEGFL